MKASFILLPFPHPFEALPPRLYSIAGAIICVPHIYLMKPFPLILLLLGASFIFSSLKYERSFLGHSI
jgi:hypothetical protein